MNDLGDLAIEFLLPEFEAFDGYTFHGTDGVGHFDYFKFGRKDMLQFEKIALVMQVGLVKQKYHHPHRFQFCPCWFCDQQVAYPRSKFVGDSSNKGLYIKSVKFKKMNGFLY
jgi:hypothetical protein